MPVDSESAAPLIEMIREIGYRATYNEMGGFISSAMAGLSVSIFYKPGMNLHFYCGMTLGEDSGFGVEEANAANMKYRFGKYTIDGDGDLVVEADHRFDIGRDGAKNDLEEIIGVWEGSLVLMKSELADARNRMAAPDDDVAAADAEGAVAGAD